MNSIELKYPITAIIDGAQKEIKYLTPTRIKLKHIRKMPVGLFKVSEKEQIILDDISSLEFNIKEEKDLTKLEELKIKLSDKKNELLKSKIKINIDIKELIPMFDDLIPFLALLFGVTNEVIDSIDFDDIESVFGCLEEVFPRDEKKN